MTSSSRDGGLSTPVLVLLLCTLQDKLTPLMWATVRGHKDVVQVLLSQQDVDINMRDEVCPSQWNGHLLSHVTACSCKSG